MVREDVTEALAVHEDVLEVVAVTVGVLVARGEGDRDDAGKSYSHIYGRVALLRLSFTAPCSRTQAS